MKKSSINRDEQDIPEFSRAQLGVGVRGKYFGQINPGSNLVALQPEIQKAFPTSEAVNKALGQHAGVRKGSAGYYRHGEAAGEKSAVPIITDANKAPQLPLPSLLAGCTCHE